MHFDGKRNVEIIQQTFAFRNRIDLRRTTTIDVFDSNQKWWTLWRDTQRTEQKQEIKHLVRWVLLHNRFWFASDSVGRFSCSATVHYTQPTNSANNNKEEAKERRTKTEWNENTNSGNRSTSHNGWCWSNVAFIFDSFHCLFSFEFVSLFCFSLLRSSTQRNCENNKNASSSSSRLTVSHFDGVTRVHHLWNWKRMCTHTCVRLDHNRFLSVFGHLNHSNVHFTRDSNFSKVERCPRQHRN